MKWEEARSEAYLGARISSPTIQTGAYVDYQFNGLRIVFPSGSHSGFRPTDADEAADWTVDDLAPPARPAQYRLPVHPLPPNVGKWGLPLPRIELGEVGKTVVVEMDGVTSKEQVERQARWARPKSVEVSLVKDGRSITEFELAQARGKAIKLNEADKWGKPVERDAWGRPK